MSSSSSTVRFRRLFCKPQAFVADDLSHRSPVQGRHWREDRRCPQARHVRPEGKTWLPPNPRIPRAVLTRHAIQGKAKYNSWQKVVDEGKTVEQAQEEYIALVNKLKESYGYDANKEPETVGA